MSKLPTIANVITIPTITVNRFVVVFIYTSLRKASQNMLIIPQNKDTVKQDF